METQQFLIFLSLSVFINAEERLSWFTRDLEIKKRIFVPDNLSEGKEENRVLPWVFHDNNEPKIMQLNCIMRGYNVSNNPSDYKDARWSHPGFSDSQVSISYEAKEGCEYGVPYAIWTIEINITAADAGKKWATCEFQQGDFPLSTDFKFLIFRKMSEDGNVLSYGLGDDFLDEKDITNQVEEDIKGQISDHYSKLASPVTRSGQRFLITVPVKEIGPTVPVKENGPEVQVGEYEQVGCFKYKKNCKYELHWSPRNGAYTLKICITYNCNDTVERIESKKLFKRLTKYY